MNFITSIRAESIKAKRTSAFWLSVIGAAFIPLIFFLMYFFKPGVFAPMFTKKPWETHFLHGWNALSAFLLPMYVILTCSLITQIEYKNNTWKQVHATPQSVGGIFFSKFFIIQAMILFCFLLFNLFLIISAVTVSLLNKKYPFLSQPIDWLSILRMNFKTYISVLGISAIQYWLSLRFKNFIAPIGIGLGLLITSLIIMNWEHISKVPYAYPLLTYSSLGRKSTHLLQNHEWNSIAYFIAFTALAFADMRFRKEKG